MLTHRFGRKIKLPSTAAIKHGILKLMLEDEFKAQAIAAKSAEDLLVPKLLGGERSMTIMDAFTVSSVQ
jgi:hypothetical protein